MNVETKSLVFPQLDLATLPTTKVFSVSKDEGMFSFSEFNVKFMSRV